VLSFPSPFHHSTPRYRYLSPTTHTHTRTYNTCTDTNNIREASKTPTKQCFEALYFAGLQQRSRGDFPYRSSLSIQCRICPFFSSSSTFFVPTWLTRASQPFFSLSFLQTWLYNKVRKNLSLLETPVFSFFPIFFCKPTTAVVATKAT